MTVSVSNEVGIISSYTHTADVTPALSLRVSVMQSNIVISQSVFWPVNVTKLQDAGATFSTAVGTWPPSTLRESHVVTFGNECVIYPLKNTQAQFETTVGYFMNLCKTSNDSKSG